MAAKRADEAIEQLIGSGFCLVDHRGEQAVAVGGGQDVTRHPYRAELSRRGELVDDRSDVLPLQNLGGVEVGGGWAHLAVDHRERVAELRQLVSATLDKRERQGVAGETPRTTHALQVRGDSAGQTGEHNGGEVADVNTHLEGGGCDENVGRVWLLVRRLEAVLVGEPRLVGQEAGVLAREHAPHRPVVVQTAVEIDRAEWLALKGSVAADGRARPASELVDDGNGARHGVAAGVAHEQRAAGEPLGLADGCCQHRARPQLVGR